MDERIKALVEELDEPQKRIGATYVPGKGTYVCIWAPKAEKVEIEWVKGNIKSQQLKAGDKGYYFGFYPEARPGDRYFFVLDGKDKIPDPASRHQPEGVFGPSEIMATEYDWKDHDWQGIPFCEWVIYELHTGTFSKEGDFEGIIKDLPRLKELGITTLEIMPVSQFPGKRNWGYDGVFPFAVQNSYGGPEGFKKLVDAAHREGLAVILDVVYNHLGPEGNVLYRCGHYTQEKYHTPWGQALNFDGPWSDEVRRYFLQTAWQWLTEFHLDGLRLDAIQTIFDTSPMPFLEELSLVKEEAEHIAGRSINIIAETDLNDSRILLPPDQGGLGMDAHWNDDLHHALHAFLTGEKDGYYLDFGNLGQIAKIYRNGVCYDGEYSIYHKSRRGRSYEGVDPRKLVVSSQNHDQIGNRMYGRRLSGLVDFEKLKLAAACVFLSPFTPFLFMGEELAAKNPFLYFVDHNDPDLIKAVQEGRKREFQAFAWQGEPPDPASPETFEKCRLINLHPRPEEITGVMTRYYQKLIKISKDLRNSYLLDPDKYDVIFNEKKRQISLQRDQCEGCFCVIFSFSDQEEEFDLPDIGEKSWKTVLQSQNYRIGELDFPEKRINDNKFVLPHFSAAVLIENKI
jgi:maltooligosyltrehalose trehalohydrolase